MKLEATLSPTPLQSSKLVAKALVNFLFVLALVVAVSPGSLRAAEESPISIVQKLAKEGVKCPIYAEAVAKLVKTYPKQAEDIMATAVKNQPPCACEVIKAGIGALTPQNEAPDPKVVAAVVAAIVQSIQASNPDLLETIVSCATEAAPNAGQDILVAISNIYTGPTGTNTSGGNPVPGVIPTPTPTPTPTPPTSPTPVTPVVPP